MKIENEKIVEITKSELISYYFEREIDDIMSFPDYLEKFKKLGCKILEY